MRIADGRCEIERGRAESPRVTIRMGLADFLRLITGGANGMQLFMTGKLKVPGDLFFAQTYQSWFDRPRVLGPLQLDHHRAVVGGGAADDPAGPGAQGGVGPGGQDVVELDQRGRRPRGAGCGRCPRGRGAASRGATAAARPATTG